MELEFCGRLPAHQAAVLVVGWAPKKTLPAAQRELQDVHVLGHAEGETDAR